MNKKTTGIIAYITWIGWIVAFCAGDKEGAKFHLNQALVILIGQIVAAVINYIPYVGGIVGTILSIFLIYHSLQLGLPVVSSMGSGGKLDPSKIAVADISKSYNCNLARMLRKRLHKLGVYKGVKVVSLH